MLAMGELMEMFDRAHDRHMRMFATMQVGIAAIPDR